MILRRSFLKLLALPVVAPLVAFSTKIRGHWREDVWVGPDGSETPLEELEKASGFDGTIYRVRVYEGIDGPLLYHQGFDGTGRRVWTKRP